MRESASARTSTTRTTSCGSPSGTSTSPWSGGPYAPHTAPRRLTRHGAASVVASGSMRLPTSEKFLHEIVSTVASSLELKEVLKAVVRLMSEASGVHACFAYLVEDDGARLVLRAASPP